MDQDITKAFTRILKKQGIKFKFNTKVTASEVTANGVTLTHEPSKGGACNTMDVCNDLIFILLFINVYVCSPLLAMLGVGPPNLFFLEQMTFSAIANSSSFLLPPILILKIFLTTG